MKIKLRGFGWFELKSWGLGVWFNVGIQWFQSMDLKGKSYHSWELGFQVGPFVFGVERL